MKRIIALTLTAMLLITVMTACDEGTTSTPAGGTKQEINTTMNVADRIASAQQTPKDIDYSLERYNLIRRAYWVNGQREKANALPCELQKPLGYIVLFAGNTVAAQFVVDGKVSSLNSFLSPDYIENEKQHSDSFGGNVVINTELPDVDGSYGENDAGIFFFTPDGKYVEWTGEYLYSDIPFEIDAPVVQYKGE